eukprot:3855854-Pyramimonas_sp.AAC.1
MHGAGQPDQEGGRRSQDRDGTEGRPGEGAWPSEWIVEIEEENREDMTARDRHLRDDEEENSVRIRPVLPPQLPQTIPR